jgi:type III secretion protein D
MIELRVASGLHRGATLPLEDRTLLIGASEEADVVLVDPGIAAHHAKLSQTDGGWVLCAEEGILRNADSNQSQALIDLIPGEFARVGDVWLMLSHENAAWENPPALPKDEELAELSADDDAGFYAERHADAPIDGADAVSPTVAASTTEAPPAPRKATWRRRLLRPMIALPLLGIAVLSAAYAIAIPFSPAAATGAQSATPLAAPTRASMSDATVNVAPPQNSTSVPALSQEALRQAWRRRLSEADLLSRFDMTLADYSWSMQAALDPDEAARFERILRAFLKEQQITFPVNVKIGSAEAMLPFRIMMVTTGANASLVTEDGQRLYVGDQYKGVTMVAINERNLVFAGKRKIVVNR